jgi:hypothetical protein
MKVTGYFEPRAKGSTAAVRASRDSLLLLARTRCLQPRFDVFIITFMTLDDSRRVSASARLQATSVRLGDKRLEVDLRSLEQGYEAPNNVPDQSSKPPNLLINPSPKLADCRPAGECEPVSSGTRRCRHATVTITSAT